MFFTPGNFPVFKKFEDNAFFGVKTMFTENKDGLQSNIAILRDYSLEFFEAKIFVLGLGEVRALRLFQGSFDFID